MEAQARPICSILQPQPPTVAQLRQIYQDRCSKDLLYAVLTTQNLARIDPHVAGIQRLVLSRNADKTVQRALQAALDSKCVVVKHALVLFALHAESAFKKYFADRSNDRVIGEFTLNNLPKYVHAMLTGHYENLETFVQDARAEYVAV